MNLSSLIKGLVAIEQKSGDFEIIRLNFLRNEVEIIPYEGYPKYNFREKNGQVEVVEFNINSFMIC